MTKLLQNLLAQIKANTSGFFVQTAIVARVSLLEDPGQILCRNADARILDRKEAVFTIDPDGTFFCSDNQVS